MVEIGGLGKDKSQRWAPSQSVTPAYGTRRVVGECPLFLYLKAFLGTHCPRLPTLPITVYVPCLFSKQIQQLVPVHTVRN